MIPEYCPVQAPGPWRQGTQQFLGLPSLSPVQRGPQPPAPGALTPRQRMRLAVLQALETTLASQPGDSSVIHHVYHEVPAALLANVENSKAALAYLEV